MRIKQHLLITDPEAFAKGDYRDCFLVLQNGDYLPDGWINCGEIELDVNVDANQVTVIAVEGIERKIQELKASSTAALTELERRKNELICITHEAGE